MKKILTMVLALILTFSLFSCGHDTPSEMQNNGTAPNKQETANSETPDSAPTHDSQEPVDLSNWGQEDVVPTNNGKTTDRYLIRVPRYKGNYHRRCKISEQLNDTVVLLSGQYIDAPEANDISDVFSAYTNSTLMSLESMYGVLSDNFSLSIDSSESVKIADRDMYKHTGKITYDYDGAKREHQYVAYVTKMEGSGNYAYWMVYDFSADQSKGELIEEQALNMSKTFREEE